MVPKRVFFHDCGDFQLRSAVQLMVFIRAFYFVRTTIDEFRQVVESQAVGLSNGEAVERIVERVPSTESNFFSIVINIQAKAGGNLSEALGNLSRVLRERKKMKAKVSAMSMEAKASAVVIGSLPFIVVILVYVSSPRYIELLWLTTTGKITTVCCIVWMSFGVLMMKKMITFDI